MNGARRNANRRAAFFIGSGDRRQHVDAALEELACSARSGSHWSS
jgi:hypothetical protein